MRVVDFALAGLAVVLGVAGVVSIVSVWASTGPNCPPPVPADWLGFCEAYDAQ